MIIYVYILIYVFSHDKFSVSAFSIQSYWKGAADAGPFCIKKKGSKKEKYIYSYLRLLGIYCLQKALTLEQQHPRQLAPINRLEQLENDLRDDGMNATPVPKICLTYRIRKKEPLSDTHTDTDTNASA